MSHVYTPSPVAITDTTLPDDGDLASAISVNTPFEATLDGVKYVQDAIDGTSSGTCTPADINVATGGLVANGTEVICGLPLIASGAVQCNSTLTVTGAVTCSSTLHAVGAVTCASTLAVTGAVTCLSVNASSFLQGASLSIPGNLSANGTMVTTANLTASGTSTVADLRATVSNSAGITYTSQGRAHYRTRQITDGELSSGVFILAPILADIFYVDSLSAIRAVKLNDSGSINGDVIELSTYGMAGGFSLEVYSEDELTLLLTMTATTNSYMKAVRKSSDGLYRIICVSDG